MWEGSSAQREYDAMLPSEQEWCCKCEEDIIGKSISHDDNLYCIYCADKILLDLGEEE